MLLAFDVGNTNIVLGVYDEKKLLISWRLKTDKHKSADEYGMLINQLFMYEKMNPKDIKHVIISTVVPPMIYTLQHLSWKYFNCRPLVVGPGVKTGLIVKYDNPKQLGADRIVNAVAAYELYDTPSIVVDFGTATTFCAITAKGEYLGGAIVPGIKISSEALFEKTAALPRVDLEAPGKVICRNTIEGIQAGVVYGNMGMLEYLVNRMKVELKEHCDDGKEPLVIATGGLATLMDSGTDCIDRVDKLLALKGLRIIFEKNRNLRGERKHRGSA